MDFMFEDEVDEVGSDVEAYCPKCKADTTHVVISKYEDEIRRVQCNPCGDVHSYRKPRGEVEDEIPEPIAAKKRALLKKPTWEEFFAKHGEKQGKPYEFTIGASEAIPGWDEGISGMKAGGKRTLVIPPAMAYGRRGYGESIPPNATLVFEVELVAVK